MGEPFHLTFIGWERAGGTYDMEHADDRGGDQRGLGGTTISRSGETFFCGRKEIRVGEEWTWKGGRARIDRSKRLRTSQSPITRLPT